MEHVAILRKDWKLLENIISGNKTIESRWYKSRRVPWNSIRVGETIYFKEAGELLTVKSEVVKVLQFKNLTRVKVNSILRKYYRRLGIGESDLTKYFNLFKDKKYCVLIFLGNGQKINKPFSISKSGFGSQTAWISVEDVESIKL